MASSFAIYCKFNRTFRVVQNRRAGEKVALGQDKQRKLPFKIMFVSCLSSPSATFALQGPFLEGPYN